MDLSVIESLLKGRRLTKPLIAAVEGPAIAGGTEILQATDIRVAGESARFGVSEPRWGLFPLGGSAVRLVRQIPYTVAADLLLTGRHIRAAEAKAIGLIGHVVPDGQALAKALELAELIAANGPLAVQAILRTIRETEAHARERRVQDRRGAGHGGLRERRRQGGPARVRREAPAQLPGPLACRSATVRRVATGVESPLPAGHSRCKWPLDGGKGQMALARPAQLASRSLRL